MRMLAALFLAFGLLIAESAQADIAVVVHPDSGVTRLDRAEVINIFMGRYRKLPTGTTALPVDLATVKQRFYLALVNKKLSEINAYWARLMFSGRARPPQQVESIRALTQALRQTRGAIGFLDAKDVTEDMRVVLTLPEQDVK